MAQTPSWKRRNKLPPCKKCGNTTRDQRGGICDKCAFPKHAMEAITDSFVKESHAEETTASADPYFPGAPASLDPTPSGPEVMPASGKKRQISRPVVGALAGGAIGGIGGLGLAERRVQMSLAKGQRRLGARNDAISSAANQYVEALETRPKQLMARLSKIEAMPTGTPGELAARGAALNEAAAFQSTVEAPELKAQFESATSRLPRTAKVVEKFQQKVKGLSGKARWGYGLALGLGGAALGAGIGMMGGAEKQANGDAVEACSKGCTCDWCKSNRRAHDKKVLLKHHRKDLREALRKGKKSVAEASRKDIEEISEGKVAAMHPGARLVRGAKRFGRSQTLLAGATEGTKRYRVAMRAARGAVDDLWSGRPIGTLSKTAGVKESVRRFLKNRNTQPKTLEQIVQTRSAMGADAFMRRAQGTGFRRPTVATRYAKAQRARTSGGPYTRHERALRGERD